MIYGYARCSTTEQRQDISRQVRELEALGCEQIVTEFESRVKEDRQGLQNLLNHLIMGDTLMCVELSRITRSTRQLCDILNDIKVRKAKLVIGSFVIDCRGFEPDPMAMGMLLMMGVFSELEREMIRSRVRSGMANAKAKGKPVGRPATTLEKLPELFLRDKTEKYSFLRFSAGFIGVYIAFIISVNPILSLIEGIEPFMV